MGPGDRSGGVPRRPRAQGLGEHGSLNPVWSELMTSGESDEGRSYEVSHVIWYDIEDRSSPGWVSWEQALSDAMEPSSQS